MTLADALSSGKIAKSDAEILLSALLGKDRTWILAHPETVLHAHEAERWTLWETRRAAGEPVAYITQRQEFFGRTFTVNRHTLVPRPATERLVETALELLGKRSEPASFRADIDAGIVAAVHVWKPLADVRLVADVGTGSGCIAVTLACERPDLRVIATDINDQTIVTAKKNASAFGVADRITFAQGENLEPLRGIIEPFLLVSNPPYIPEGTPLQEDVVSFEPHAALFSGTDGADVLRAIVSQAKAHPYCHGYVIECRKEQAEALG